VILLSENTHALLRRDEVKLDRRPEVPLKGKSVAVELYAPVMLTIRRDIATTDGRIPSPGGAE
jgi:hypothetical protein